MVEQVSLDLGKIETRRLNVFARHETFHPRFGWLKKGFDRAAQDPGVFLQEDAPVRLGVGKNMVRSIRYWCAAFKVLEDDRPTAFGQQLLGKSGWDQYLEDPASLWLLHWKLLEPPCQATAWYFTFNDFRAIEFTQDDLFDQLCDYRDRAAPRIVESSLRKDLSCILRMYVEQPAKSFSEDSLDCPFTELGLIHTAGDSRHYTFRVGKKRNLPAEVTVFACLHHADRTAERTRTIPIANLLYDFSSPGLVFKLTESAICEAIEQVARRCPAISLTDAAGKLQFVFEDEPSLLAEQILNEYYCNSHR